MKKFTVDHKLSDKVKSMVVSSSIPEDATQSLLKYSHTVQEKLANAIVKYDIRGGKSGYNISIKYDVSNILYSGSQSCVSMLCQLAF